MYKEMLSHLVNEDFDKADELFHSIVVESSRDIYGQIMSEADEDEIGGDMGEDFLSDIEADEEEIETDELQDGEVEVGGEEGEGSEEDLDTDEKVEDLEAQIEQLRAEFENLMKGELEEPEHDVEDFDSINDAGEFEGGDEFDPEHIEEATKFSDEVSVSMDKEGQYSGTGKGSEKAKVNAKSPYSEAQRKESEPKGKGPVDFAGGDEKGQKADKAKDYTPSTNVDEEPEDFSHEDQKGDGKYVGTGKGSKTGQTQSKSPLSKKPA